MKWLEGRPLDPIGDVYLIWTGQPRSLGNRPDASGVPSA